MYKKSSRTVRVAVFALIAAITAQLTVFPLAAVSFGQEPANQTTELVIPDGTELTVVTTEEISSKTATEGDPLSFKVSEDVVVNGHVVIAKDTLVKGTVASAKKSGFFGRGGNLGIRIESVVTVDNQKVKLRSVKGKEGGNPSQA